MLKIPITGIVLAGGKSSRMNGNDKGLMKFKGKPLYLHVIDCIVNQVSDIIINSNQNQTIYQQSGFSVISDEISGFLGPLSGIYSGLIHSQTNWNLFVSCDTPFLPNNLVEKLLNQVINHNAAYVFDGDQAHPTILLINKTILSDIKQYLDNGERKLVKFLQQIDAIPVNFSQQKAAFININTTEELAYWEKIK